MHPVDQACFAYALLSEFELCRRDRYAVYVNAKARCVHRKTAPPAADFQNLHAFAQAERIDDALILRMLCGFERLMEIAVEHRARIGERRIQPLRVERVADVVMRVNIAPAARSR